MGGLLWNKKGYWQVQRLMHFRPQQVRLRRVQHARNEGSVLDG